MIGKKKRWFSNVGFTPSLGVYPFPTSLSVFFFEFLGTKFAKLPKDSFLKVPSGKIWGKIWMMEEIQRSSVDSYISLSHFLHGFIHFRWSRISSINSMDDVDGKSGEPVELGSFDPSILEVFFPYILGAPGLNLSMKNIFTQMIIVLMISEKSPKKYGYLLREGDLTIDISQ